MELQRSFRRGCVVEVIRGWLIPIGVQCYADVAPLLCFKVGFVETIRLSVSF